MTMIGALDSFIVGGMMALAGVLIYMNVKLNNECNRKSHIAVRQVELSI